MRPQFRSRPLQWTEVQRAAVSLVFGRHYNVTRVRLRLGGVPSWGACRTIGERIYLQAQWGDAVERDHPRALALLVHELVHVWQFRRLGWRYALLSLTAQAWATVRTGSRRAAYHYQLVREARLSDYGMEQQAQIVEDWYLAMEHGDWSSVAAHWKDWPDETLAGPPREAALAAFSTEATRLVKELQWPRS